MNGNEGMGWSRIEKLFWGGFGRLGRTGMIRGIMQWNKMGKRKVKDIFNRLLEASWPPAVLVGGVVSVGHHPRAPALLTRCSHWLKNPPIAMLTWSLLSNQNFATLGFFEIKIIARATFCRQQ